MNPSEKYNLIDLSTNIKGLNTARPYINIDPQSASVMQNMFIADDGSLLQRTGSKLVATTMTGACRGCKAASPDIGQAVWQSLAIFDNKIYHVGTGATTPVEVTGTATLTTGADSHYSMVAAWKDTTNYIIGTDGVVNPFYIPLSTVATGSLLSLSSDIGFETARLVTQFKGRLVWAYTKESATYYPNRIRWSNINTFSTYGVNNWTDECADTDGSAITSLINIWDELYIFKNSKSQGIKKLAYTGSSGMPFGVVSVGDVGCPSSRAAVPITSTVLGEGIVYWGMDNKIRFFDGSLSTIISLNIDPTIRAIWGNNDDKWTHLITAIDVTYLHQVWFHIPDATGVAEGKHSIIAYDYEFNAFWIYKDLDVNNWMYSNSTVYFGNKNGHWMEVDNFYYPTGVGYDLIYTSSTLTTIPITAIYQSQWLDMSAPVMSKKIKDIETHYSAPTASSIYLSYAFDYSTTLTTQTIAPNSGHYDDPVWIAKNQILSSGDERVSRFRLEKTDILAQVKFNRWAITFKPTGKKDVI